MSPPVWQRWREVRLLLSAQASAVLQTSVASCRTGAEGSKVLEQRLPLEISGHLNRARTR